MPPRVLASGPKPCGGNYKGTKTSPMISGEVILSVLMYKGTKTSPISRNARPGSYYFLFIILIILNKITQTRYFVRVTYYLKRFNGFQYAHMFYLNQSEI